MFRPTASSVARFTAITRSFATAPRVNKFWHIRQPAEGEGVQIFCRGKPVTQEQITEMTKPTMVDGRWRKASVTSRRINELRGLFAEKALPCPFPRRERKPIKGYLVSKGKKHEREREARQAKIALQVSKMDELIEQRRKIVREAVKKTGIEAQLDQLTYKRGPKYSLEQLMKDLPPAQAP